MGSATACPCSGDSAQLPRPRATLLIPDGGVLATRVHYETLNDAMFLLRVTLLSSVLCLASVVLLSLATANVDIKLGIKAITSYPKLLFSSTVWSSTSIFSAILVGWFMVYCIFSHIIRLHFNTTDPPRDWDDRNGEWSVVELDVRARPKQSLVSIRGNREADGTEDGPESPSLLPGCVEEDPTMLQTLSASDQWKLGVLPATKPSSNRAMAEISLLTPDQDYLAWYAKHKGCKR
ncbi:hypothetical protein GGI25_005220 [Coemansia spiralis]|uniref:Uncharacterized protein n=2 Tax=Coemansia TaxID=4863 RepID=A0A9W8G2P9_9FUNG|nr:hypothetical protein BX070DRAFT_230401 [Coemansia spiralis]KAJ1995618.1 hypothetical protein EDC05_000856 [Coemansia umbellata]KAJ2625051.1 hypothetical protein GGI26_000854 [Coemansia sp. RSA 1358]KAJ2672188.1 hypothetical protein GGI25_005220 [Coemansia spiralis]